jgi:hypothetical protein
MVVFHDGPFLKRDTFSYRHLMPAPSAGLVGNRLLFRKGRDPLSVPP